MADENELDVANMLDAAPEQNARYLDNQKIVLTFISVSLQLRNRKKTNSRVVWPPFAINFCIIAKFQKHIQPAITFTFLSQTLSLDNMFYTFFYFSLSSIEASYSKDSSVSWSS